MATSELKYTQPFKRTICLVFGFITDHFVRADVSFFKEHTSRNQSQLLHFFPSVCLMPFIPILITRPFEFSRGLRSARFHRLPSVLIRGLSLVFSDGWCTPRRTLSQIYTSTGKKTHTKTTVKCCVRNSPSLSASVPLSCSHLQKHTHTLTLTQRWQI